MVLGFDFNFPGPVQPLERFLRVLYYDANHEVKLMSLEICKFSLNDPCFLNYRPSMVAASALIISINLFQKNKSDKNNFFVGCQINFGLMEMNLEIWNNKRVFYLTGYSIEDLK